MVEALEERASQELINRDEAILALQKELELVTAKRKRLAKEVAGLRSAQQDFEELKVKVETLSSAIDNSKAIERLVLGRAEKANETAEGLRKEIDVEKASGTALVA